MKIEIVKLSDNFKKIIIYKLKKLVYSRHIGRKGAQERLFATFLC